MNFEHVCLESCGYTLPEEVVTSAEIEQRLEPLYTRLRLTEGRLELMTGIRERRFWPRGTMPSEKSIESSEKAIHRAGIDRRHIGALVHGSVCRDFLEPATACGVHHGLGLSAECMVFDVSNACLGLLNGLVQVANMIELGQIRAGLVVGTEGSRQLVEHTIETLNADKHLTRDMVKRAVASLTIGSGSCAVLLVERQLSRTENHVRSVTARANSAFHDLCHSGRDEAALPSMRPLMETDSERLMCEGVATGALTFESFLRESGWQRDDIDKTFCHQVGAAHRKLLFEQLRLDPRIDYSTVEWLGNTGSVALPLTLALASDSGHLQSGDKVAMLGIGSGINCLMLAVQWQRSPLKRPDDLGAQSDRAVSLSPLGLPGG